MKISRRQFIPAAIGSAGLIVNASSPFAATSGPSNDGVTLKTNPHGFKQETTAPKRPVPHGACDTHMHIVGPFSRYPKDKSAALNPPEALLDDYLRMAKTVGLERNVVVQPSFFGRDNSCTLDSVARLGERARAIVAVDPDIAEAELKQMHDRGARGVRLQSLARGGVGVEALENVAKAIAPFGWHAQIFIDSRSLPDMVSLLKRLPVDLVFDHMAHADARSTVDEPGFKILLDLLSTGRFWVKISNGRFEPDGERARRLIAANPERVLWGSDWPHVVHEGLPPDDGPRLDRLWDWIPNEQTHRAILVDNPGKLFFHN